MTIVLMISRHILCAGWPVCTGGSNRPRGAWTAVRRSAAGGPALAFGLQRLPPGSCKGFAQGVRVSWSVACCRRHAHRPGRRVQRGMERGDRTCCRWRTSEGSSLTFTLPRESQHPLQESHLLKLKPSISRLSVGALVALVCAVSPLSAGAVRIDLWPTEVDPPKGTRIDDEHPCGKVILMDVDRMPRPAPWFSPDLVRELDSKGRVLRTWRVPTDHSVVGLTGDVVWLAWGSEPKSMLGVRLDGRLKEVHKAPSKKPLPTRRCPGPHGTDEGSVCVLVGPASGRILSYPAVCS